MRRLLVALLVALGFGLGVISAPIIGQAQTTTPTSPPTPCAPDPAPATATGTPSATVALTATTTVTATATAAPGPTHTPTTAATATLGPIYLPLIYDDATAAGWSRSGYTVSIFDETSPPPYSGAKAMRIAYGGWGGVRFTPSAPVTLSGTLSLALRGAGKMRVIVGSTQIGLLAATDAWVVHRLPLPGSVVSMIELKNDLSSATTMYVDLLGVESTGTPTPSPTASPASPTHTPTAPPAGGALRILPLGDSITEGVNGGYRDVLYTRLVAAGYTVDYVGPRHDQYASAPDKDHAGTPGFNTGNVLSNVDGYLSAYDPDVVLLMIGTNDLAWWTVEQPADVVARVSLIIDKAQASGAALYLATIPPASDTSVPPNGRSRAALVDAYNDQLRALAVVQGVPLVDVEQALTLANLYDGIHPSEAAHDTLIAPLWAEAILP